MTIYCYLAIVRFFFVFVFLCKYLLYKKERKNSLMVLLQLLRNTSGLLSRNVETKFFYYRRPQLYDSTIPKWGLRK